MKFCSHCGAQSSGSENFCKNCGAPLANANNNTNQSQYQQTSQPYVQSSTNGGECKSKMAAGLLGIFLGSFGVHNFYLGYTGKAVAQLVLTIFTCGISGIWGFIEGILILCGSIKVDGKGNPLGE